MECMSWLEVETDRIRMETHSDISDNCFPVSFCWHRFLEKQVKQGSREAADEKQSVIGRLKEKHKQLMRPADSQKGSTLTVG
jgi:hypothetical protein